MKKILTLALALALTLSLVACGGDKSAKAPPAPPESSTTTKNAPATTSKPSADLVNPEYTPEQLAVAEKFSAMTDQFQVLADTINADENLLAVQELVDSMNTIINAINEDDALFTDPANLTDEVLKNLEEGIVVGNSLLSEMEAMVANYSDKTIVTVPVEIVNVTGVEIHALAMSPTNDENWGSNLLDTPLLADESGVTQMTFTEDSLVWDLLAIDAEDGTLEFMGLDFSEAPMEGAKLMLEVAEDGTYTAYFAE